MAPIPRTIEGFTMPADDVRMRHLARCLHCLGERPLYEFLREIDRGEPLRETLEAYASIAPLAWFIREMGGADLIDLREIPGGRQ
jgi:hypothetical protein